MEEQRKTFQIPKSVRRQKTKDIYTGNTGTVQTVNPKNQFPFPDVCFTSD